MSKRLELILVAAAVLSLPAVSAAQDPCPVNAPTNTVTASVGKVFQMGAVIPEMNTLLAAPGEPWDGQPAFIDVLVGFFPATATQVTAPLVPTVLAKSAFTAVPSSATANCYTFTTPAVPSSVPVNVNYVVGMKERRGALEGPWLFSSTPFVRAPAAAPLPGQPAQLSITAVK